MIQTSILGSGFFLLHGEVGGRPLMLPLIRGSKRVILLDTGCASHVDSLILPGLAELGLTPGDLTDIIVTHSDVDHQGGNAGMKQHAPQARLACGEADATAVADPAVILQERYDVYRKFHGHHYDEPTLEWLRTELGDPQPLDLTYRGGELIDAGDGLILEVVSLPGHSHGHLGIWDPRSSTLFAGDAIHGDVYLDTKGQAALCPTYLHVQDYLKTIDRIINLEPLRYVGCHWPVQEGAEAVRAFAETSRTFVLKAESLILEAITAAGSDGIGLTELCEKLGPQLGTWPAPVNHELCYAFNGHLEDLVSRNRIRPLADASPAKFVLS